MAKFLQNAVFEPKWCKTQKTLLSTQNIEKSSLSKKGLSQPTVDAKRIFKQEIVKF